jgi:hypothetical protein
MKTHSSQVLVHAVSPKDRPQPQGLLKYGPLGRGT